jgi:hypothetical protein
MDHPIIVRPKSKSSASPNEYYALSQNWLNDAQKGIVW